MKYAIQDNLVVFDNVTVEYLKSPSSIAVEVNRHERIGQIVAMLVKEDDDMLRKIYNQLLART